MDCCLGLVLLDKLHIHKVLMDIGRGTGCHQMPERSFYYHGYQFPVCARCTGVLLGQILGMVLFFKVHLSWNWCSFFMFIMFFDWFLQRMKICSSTNIRRLITGFLCGYSLGQCYIAIILKGIWLVKKM